MANTLGDIIRDAVLKDGLEEAVKLADMFQEQKDREVDLLNERVKDQA